MIGMFVLPRTADNIAERKIEAFSSKRRKKITSGSESQESVISADAVDVGNSTREDDREGKGYSPAPKRKKQQEEIEVSHEGENSTKGNKASANGAYSNALKGGYAEASAESLSFAV